METHKRICVLGLGNLMRSDDAVGMMAVRSLSESGDFPAVDFVDGGTLGLDLMYALKGVTHLLALDAVDVGAVPGAMARFEDRELDRIPAAKSAHLLGFSDLIGVLTLLGDAPGKIVLLGVQPQSTGWGTSLSDEVQQALPVLLRESRRQMEAWLEEDEEETRWQQGEKVQAHA